MASTEMLQTDELAIVELEDNRVREIAVLNKQLIEDEGYSNAMTIVQLEVRMRDWLKSEYSCLGMEENGKIISYALWRDDIEYYYVRQLFTCRNFRRRGIAKKLMSHLESKVLTDKPIRLEVLACNEIAMNFYENLGTKSRK